MSTGSDPRSPTLYGSDDLDSGMALVHLTGRSDTGATTVYSPERSHRPKARKSTSPTPGIGPAAPTLLSVEEEDLPVRELINWLSERSHGDTSLEEETFLMDYFEGIWRLHEQWMGTSWVDHHLTHVSQLQVICYEVRRHTHEELTRISGSALHRPSQNQAYTRLFRMGARGGAHGKAQGQGRCSLDSVPERHQVGNSDFNTADCAAQIS